jgi:hypothetical protein
VAKSLDDLEANPKSKGQAMVLSDRIAEANVAAGVEIMKAVDKLVEELAKAKAAPSNVHIETTMTGRRRRPYGR